MKRITTITEIDYKRSPEGRLLFQALIHISVTTHRNFTPDEIVAFLSDKADDQEADELKRQQEWETELNNA